MKTKMLFITLFLLTACVKNTLSIPKSSDRPSIGMLIKVDRNALFKTDNHDIPVETLSSHGLVISQSIDSNAKMKVLLSDGQLAWGDIQDNSFKLEVKPLNTEDTLSVKQYQDTISNNTPPLWLDISSTGLKIVGSSDDSYTVTPNHILKNGRIIDEKSFFFWPEMKVENTDSYGFVSLSDLSLSFKNTNKVMLYGLIQEPFLLLTNENINIDITDIDQDYIELTDASPAANSIKNVKKMRLIQTVQLDKPLSHNIRSVNLYSGNDNCHIFSVKWVNSENRNFGYCKHSFADPTPVITSIKVNDQGNTLNISAIEVYGDETRLVHYDIKDITENGNWLNFRL